LTYDTSQERLGSAGTKSWLAIIVLVYRQNIKSLSVQARHWACNDSHLPVVQAGNLIVFIRSELRRVTAGAVVGVVEAHWGLAHPSGGNSWPRQNRGLPASRVLKPPNVRSTWVETKASLACTPATAESWLRAYDRAPLGKVQSFHASGSAKDLGSEYSRKRRCPSFVKARAGTC
jgi:hypothetical protein